RAAPATILPEDFLFSAAWEWAERRGERGRAAAIEEPYLEHIGRCCAVGVEQALVVFGRPIAHIVVLHANALNAAMLDRVVDRMTASFGRPLTIDEALSDPAYD